jgi:CheY-like chemotaxis protein/anti-sigma regulatory factor (Ser/Thr protein kinase)
MILIGSLDSSRRAVEAADNVVHAYDLNMQMPEVSSTPNEKEPKGILRDCGLSVSYPQTPGPSESNFVPSPPPKKRERSEEQDFHPGPPLKRMFMMTEAEILQTYYSDEATTPGGLTVAITETIPSTTSPSEIDWSPEREGSDSKRKQSATPVMLTPGHHRIMTRDFMRALINEALRHGHPTKEVHKDTVLGEVIEFRTIGSRGEIQDRTIFLEIEADVPTSFVTEEQQLEFALQKLIDNAIKFTEHGRITITVQMRKNRSVVEIRILDTGCGISEESRSNLFKPHFQEDASISRAKDGLGLSLFNAKAHVRKNLGGDVTLERSATEGPSKGSEFMIRLPITALDLDETQTSLLGSAPISLQPSETTPSFKPVEGRLPIPSSSKSIPQQCPVQGSPRSRKAFNPALASDYPLNILIAEDNAINRNVAIGTLNKLGYKAADITLAFDGLEAVNLYKTSLDRSPSERFNCVLMDIWMPNMDGYEATTKIMELAKENGDPLKIIAVTADITEESISRAKAAGMQGFLAKPYKVLDIEHLIMEHFQCSR